MSDERLFDLYSKALPIATRVHWGQKRRGGDQYAVHPIRVSQLVQTLGGTPEQVCAAVLHDVLEMCNEKETAVLADEIYDACGNEVLSLVLILSKDPQETYTGYITRVKAVPEAALIKICDIVDNLADRPTDQQQEKYARALAQLTGVQSG